VFPLAGGYYEVISRGGAKKIYKRKKRLKVKKGDKYITHTQRLVLESCYNAGMSKKEIAKVIGMSLRTVYRELERGKCEKKVLKFVNYWGDRFYKTITVYSSDIAEERYNLNKTAKGPTIKIGNDFDFVRYFENEVLINKRSPHAVWGNLKRNGNSFKTSVSKTTLYRYIRQGIFMNITMKDLPFGERVKHYKKAVAKRPPRGTSIEHRPIEIGKRINFGHWEMDCVCGPTLSTLLVLSERFTRREIIFKMSDQKSESVIKCLNKLEYKFGKNFKKIFKSITVDNGAEFSDFKSLEKSIFGRNCVRTKIYYCHPYSSYERGTNERLNREIRRLIPKGSDLSKFSDDYITYVENWVNSYPREVLGFATSDELYQTELAKL
jgi:IS30 family transposase